MGCDIHNALELKIAGKWIYAGSLVSHRNYLIFTILSGVRAENNSMYIFKYHARLNMLHDCIFSYDEYLQIIAVSIKKYPCSNKSAADEQMKRIMFLEEI